MGKKKREPKEKKIIFSEEIDSSVTGFSVGVSFVVVALLIWFLGLFHNRIAEGIVTIVLLFVGIGGTFLEIEKSNQRGIKGFDDFGLGTIISMLLICFILKFDFIVLNIACALGLLFSVYATFSGIMKIGYSIKIQKRKTENRKMEIIKIITGMTEIIALIVVILQLVAELL